ncbi:MAG: shikimate kinase, partial [Bacteroidaceae bacterium]|nr:shikimate kinase [Bacteroidaceae bacterium]
GTTIYLHVPNSRLFERLSIAKSKRPLLKDKNDEEIVAFREEQIKKREPFYSQANYTFEADRLENIEQIKESVERFREQFGL